MSKYKKLIISILLITLSIDQLTKYLVTQNLAIYQSWPTDGIFRFTYVTNTGTAFGLLQNQSTFLTIGSFIAIFFLYYLYKNFIIENKLLNVAVGLQLGGAIGNLIDRLRLGFVIDFIDIGWWPVFNIADSSIIIGIAIISITIIFEPRQNTQNKKQTETPKSQISGNEE
jgi:signal peptidase II